VKLTRSFGFLVSYQGKTNEGTDKTAEQTTLNACNHYCRKADQG